jgi:hypothetical protein
MRDKLFKILRENRNLVTICSGNSSGNYWHFCYSGAADNHFCIMNDYDKITFQKTTTIVIQSFDGRFQDTRTKEAAFTAEEILQRDDFGKDIKDFVIFNLDLFM